MRREVRVTSWSALPFFLYADAEIQEETDFQRKSVSLYSLKLCKEPLSAREDDVIFAVFENDLITSLKRDQLATVL